MTMGLFKKKKQKKKEEKIVEEVEKPITPFNQLGLNDKLDRINDVLETGIKSKKGKEKGFRLPGSIRSASKKYDKKNKVIVFLVKTNKSLIPLVTQIYKGMVWINDNWHSIPVDSIIYYKNKIPCIILPEWDLIPLSPDKLYGDAVQNHRLIDPQTLVIRALKMEASLTPKKLAGKMWIWIILGGVAAIYVIFGGAK